MVRRSDGGGGGGVRRRSSPLLTRQKDWLFYLSTSIDGLLLTPWVCWSSDHNTKERTLFVEQAFIHIINCDSSSSSGSSNNSIGSSLLLIVT